MICLSPAHRITLLLIAHEIESMRSKSTAVIVSPMPTVDASPARTIAERPVLSMSRGEYRRPRFSSGEYGIRQCFACDTVHRKNETCPKCKQDARIEAYQN